MELVYYIFAFLKKIKVLAFLSLFGFTIFIILTKTSLVYQKLSKDDKPVPRPLSKSNHWSEIDTFPVKPFPQIKLFCWILTRKQNINNRAIYIRDTWAKRCDKTIFFQSDNSNYTFPTIGLKIRQRKESKNTNIVKAIRAWRYVYRKYGPDYDFFIKTDDDVYVVVENLKLFLAQKDPASPEFYAHRTLLGQGREPFDQAGSGIILTRESLKRLVSQVFLQKPQCLLDDKYGDAEDWKTAFCLSFVTGSRGIDTRDSLGRERIFPFRPGYHISDKFPLWFKREYEYEYSNMMEKGPNCCSFYPFAFHDIKGTSHLMMDYIFYNIRVRGEKDTLFDNGLLEEPVDKLLEKQNSIDLKIKDSPIGSVKGGLAYPHHEHNKKGKKDKVGVEDGESSKEDEDDTDTEITTFEPLEDYPTILLETDQVGNKIDTSDDRNEVENMATERPSYREFLKNKKLKKVQ